MVKIVFSNPDLPPKYLMFVQLRDLAQQSHRHECSERKLLVHVQFRGPPKAKTLKRAKRVKTIQYINNFTVLVLFLVFFDSGSPYFPYCDYLYAPFLGHLNLVFGHLNVIVIQKCNAINLELILELNISKQNLCNHTYVAILQQQQQQQQYIYGIR